jgi:regulatory protein spx
VITAYLYNSCSSCRNAEAILKESGANFETREFFKQRLTREELTGLMERASLSATDLLSSRSTPYRKKGLADLKLGNDEIIDLMLEEPRLLKRPVLVSGPNVVIGYKADAIRELVAMDNGR